ncbi:MAG: protein kinase [Clostridia bacterium]|nr:protein kinase [Clostridia bacterium]
MSETITSGTPAYHNSAEFEAALRANYDDIRVLNTTGGGGVIYAGIHRRLGVKVVLKKIRAEHIDTIGSRREMEVLLNLKHTCLPQIFDFWQYGNDVYTVMEFIEGKSLKEHLDGGRRFTEKEVIKLMRQLAGVLSYLHNSPGHIIHADIKPANIMLTPTGDLCLIDFNVSTLQADAVDDTIGYTPGYAPPEQLWAFVRHKQKTHGTATASAPATAPAAPTASPVNASPVNASPVNASPANAATVNTAAVNTAVDHTHLDNDPDRTYLDDEARTYLKEDAERTTLGRTTLGNISPAGIAQTATVKTATVVTPTVGTPTVGTPTVAPGSPAFANVNGKTPGHIGKPGSLFAYLEDEADKIGRAFGETLVVDAKSDIYSACATMYHLLTGHRPLPAGADTKQIPAEKLLPNVNDAFADILRHGMESDPRKRFPSADKLLSALDKLAKSTKRYKRMRFAQDMTVIVLVMLLCAGAIGIYLGGSMKIETATANALTEAQTMYDAGQYEAVPGYISDNLLDKPYITEGTVLGEGYYLIGCSYLALEDYISAAEGLRMAVFCDGTKPLYYRDYGIALVRCGQTDTADEALRQAEALGLSGAGLSLLQGEIFSARGEYEDSLAAYEMCFAQSTDDDAVTAHALIGRDDVLAAMYGEEDTASLKLRTEALTAGADAISAASAYRIPVLGRLAQTALSLGTAADAEGDTDTAVSAVGTAADAYRTIVDSGYATLTEWLNLSVCLQSIGQYEEAKAVLLSAEERYADRYELYKRLAFLELDVQYARPYAERNYLNFRDWGTKAVKMYQSLTTGEEDPEIEYLVRTGNEVVENGWFVGAIGSLNDFDNDEE